MGTLLHFHSVLLGILALLVILIKAQDQSGFISIDCGLPENLNYSDKITTINYTSDANFINTGVSKRVQPIGNVTVKQQLEYVRSFPNGEKNCYKINVINGTKYLIRAIFYYGNYDNLNKPSQFDLHLGANVWDTVKSPLNVSLFQLREIIYTPSLDYIQPCLVNTGNGTPFISAIELRPLNDTIYITDSANSVLSLYTRLDIGSITNLQYRYKNDVYDRIWLPFQWIETKQLNTSNNLLVQNDYNPTAIVMSTAATPVNVSAPLQLEWVADNVTDQYYIYLHFNEVVELTANETRAFNITVNGKLLYGPEIPVYQSVDTIYTTTPLTGAARYLISLSKTENSTLPPILNAVEIYRVKDFSQSETT
ncbi:putative LRR receptor serine/threonine-protein kinase [Trifolium repens]|nr:putative LRR receptor serine/threonine-protein kinase [Trifolium repens]